MGVEQRSRAAVALELAEGVEPLAVEAGGSADRFAVRARGESAGIAAVITRSSSAPSTAG